MKYWNDVHNRLYKMEGETTIEVFSGNPVRSIDCYIKETTNPQRYITESIMIFINRKKDIESMLWSASGGAYYQDLAKIERLANQIENANKELKLINSGDTQDA